MTRVKSWAFLLSIAVFQVGLICVNPTQSQARVFSEAKIKKAAQTLARFQDFKKTDIEAALDILRHHEIFVPMAADALFTFLKQSKDPELRGKAAETLYLHFHYKRGQYPLISKTLMRADVLISVQRLLLEDPVEQVRTHLAWLGQILLFSFDNPEDPSQKALIERIAQDYIPVYLMGMGHTSPELRNEIGVALDNLSVTDFYKTSPWVRRRFELLMDYAKNHPEPGFEYFIEILQPLYDKIPR